MESAKSLPLLKNPGVERNHVVWNAQNRSTNSLTALSLSLSLPLRVSRRSRVRIPLKPWFFQASFQLLKLENLLRWSFLHFDLQPQFKYINYFIYTSQNYILFIDCGKCSGSLWNLSFCNNKVYKDVSRYSWFRSFCPSLSLIAFTKIGL